MRGFAAVLRGGRDELRGNLNLHQIVKKKQKKTT
jgi:hypothetical protein